MMNFKLRTDEIWKSNQRAIETSTKVIGAKIMSSQYFVVCFISNSIKI